MGNRSARTSSVNGVCLPPSVDAGRTLTTLEASRRRGWIAVLVFTSVIAVGTLLLTTARSRKFDPVGDLTYIKGSARASPAGRVERLPSAMADVVDAHVSADGSDLVFTVTVGSTLPGRLKEGSLDIRWDITAAASTWTVAVVLDDSLSASVQWIEHGYGTSTIDGTFPGDLWRGDRTVRVSVPTEEIRGFPHEFAWSIQTSLRTLSHEHDSARVEDRAPDAGMERFDT